MAAIDWNAPRDPLGDLLAAKKVIDDLRRTIIVPKQNLAEVTAAFADWPLVEVVAGPVPAGAAYVMKVPTLTPPPEGYAAKWVRDYDDEAPATMVPRPDRPT